MPVADLEGTGQETVAELCRWTEVDSHRGVASSLWFPALLCGTTYC